MLTVVNIDILNKKGNNVYLCFVLFVIDSALSITSGNFNFAYILH